MNAGPLRAGIYCRLSLARDGDTTKVDDQERISRELCKHRGWDVAEVYTDNSRSAWQRNRKRPGWDRMLTDVGAGRLEAIVVYHGDRLARQPFDLETLINLSYGKGIKLASPTGTRDLSNDDDLFILRIEVASQCRDSASTSRRMKADIARRARNGVANTGGRGGRLFGFATDGVTHIPAEAAVVREVNAAVRAGDAVRHIAADLRARGVTTTAGTPMHPLAVRRMITSPRYAALMPDGTSAAAWEPVVPRDGWEAAVAMVTGRVAALGHNARKYLLSGIAMCGVCGAPMQVLPAHTARWTGTPMRVAARYGCLRPGCRRVFRSLTLLDGYVAASTVGYLNDPRKPAGRVPAVPGLAAEWRAIAADRAATEAMIADPAKGHRVNVLLARLDALDTRLAQLRELTEHGARTRLLDGHTGLTVAAFAALPLGVQRALVSACFTVKVLPASARGPGFRPDDVVLTPR